MSFAALGTMTTAYIGLQSWKRELRLRNNYQLAKQILIAIYNVRDAIRQVRSSLVTVRGMGLTSERGGDCI